MLRGLPFRSKEGWLLGQSGINTTPPKYHMLLENRAPSGGRMCSDSTSFSEVLSGVN